MDFKYNDIFQDYTYSVKSNGFDIVFVNKKTNKLGIVWSVFSGSNQETYLVDGQKKTNYSGTAHFVEHLKIKECTDVLINSFIDGFTVNGATSQYNTNYSIMGSRDNIYNNLFSTFFRLVFNFNVNDKLIEEEKSIIANEMMQRHGEIDQPFNYKNFVVDQTATIPTTKATIGTLDDINSITRESIIEFYNVNYVKNNMAFFVIGDFENEDKINEFLNKFDDEFKKYDNIDVKILDGTDKKYQKLVVESINYPKYEIHNICEYGDYLDLQLEFNVGKSQFELTKEDKNNWYLKVNVISLCLTMLKAKMVNKDSKEYKLFFDEFGQETDKLAKGLFLSNLGFAGSISIQLANELIDVDVDKFVKFFVKAYKDVDSYFDNRFYDEIVQRTKFSKFKCEGRTFVDTFKHCEWKVSSQSYNPQMIINFDEKLLELTVDDIKKIIDEFVIKSIGKMYFVRKQVQ